MPAAKRPSKSVFPCPPVVFFFHLTGLQVYMLLVFFPPSWLLLALLIRDQRWGNMSYRLLVRGKDGCRDSTTWEGINSLTAFSNRVRRNTCFCFQSEQKKPRWKSPAAKVVIVGWFKDAGEEVLQDICLFHVGFIRFGSLISEGLKMSCRFSCWLVNPLVLRVPFPRRGTLHNTDLPEWFPWKIH